MWGLSGRRHEKVNSNSSLGFDYSKTSPVKLKKKDSNLLKINSVAQTNATYSNYIILTKCCKWVIGIISIQELREGDWLLTKYRADCCQKCKSS